MKSFSKDTAPVAQDSANSAGYLRSLDGWRALAVVAVILNHGNQALLPNDWNLKIPGFGGYGVELFFAISGLLIFSKLGEEREKTGTLNLKLFFARRFFRLAPALLFYLAACVALSLFGIIQIKGADLMACLLLYRNYLASFHSSDAAYYTGHFWSLAVEGQFYLVAPLIVLFCARSKLLVTLPLMAVAVGIWRGIESRYGLSQQFFPGLTFDVGRTDLCLDHLLWGAWFGLLIASKQGRAWLARWLSSSYAQYTLLTLLVLLMTAPIPSRKIWFAIVAPCLLSSTILNPQTSLGRGLEHPVLRWISKVSYSLYLWQQLFLLQHGSLQPLALPPLGWVQNFPWGIPCTIVAGAISFYCVEDPIRKWGSSLLKHWKAITPRISEVSRNVND